MVARPALLSLLSLAFLARVAGQLAALLAEPAFLPPFDAWHSGLLPYPALLAAQVAILAFQARVLADVRRGHGGLARPGPRVARGLRRFALVYAAVMAARYPLTMWLSPASRWSGGAIPSAFHLVLAAWLLAYAQKTKASGSALLAPVTASEPGSIPSQAWCASRPTRDVKPGDSANWAAPPPEPSSTPKEESSGGWFGCARL